MEETKKYKQYIYVALLALIFGGIGGYVVNNGARLGSLALPTATQEATTTGWADDGSVVRLDTSTDKVGIGTTSPGQELSLAGSIFVQETSGTTTIGAATTGTGVGSCIQLKTTNGVNVRLYATTTPVAGTGIDALRIETGS